ncbi:hypothetical protein [Ensifer sp. M14]|uniref:hypothetical protein n=2 Tax=Sinorhizobium/Ensifer group TaxID=227292 RepID=UPI0013147D0E|nr:hypothetical protein [Ensifer sp. M14]
MTKGKQTVKHRTIGDIETGGRIVDGNERGNQDQMHFAKRHGWSNALSLPARGEGPLKAFIQKSFCRFSICLGRFALVVASNPLAQVS